MVKSLSWPWAISSSWFFGASWTLLAGLANSQSFDDENDFYFVPPEHRPINFFERKLHCLGLAVANPQNRTLEMKTTACRNRPQ